MTNAAHQLSFTLANNTSKQQCAVQFLPICMRAHNYAAKQKVNIGRGLYLNLKEILRNLMRVISYLILIQQNSCPTNQKI